MKRYEASLLVVALALIAAFSTGCNKLKARNDLNEGVMAYKNAQFPQAIEYFQEAVHLDPSLLVARLYLATALAHQYVPESQDPSNVQAGMRAIEAYKQVLAVDPNNTNALGSVGNLYYEMEKFDEAKSYQQKLMKLEPNNPDPHYWIGVIDWPLCYKEVTELRRKLNLNRPKNPLNPESVPMLPPKARKQLEDQIGSMVTEAMNNLQQAIQLKPNDANAYSYLNLMYRVKADLEPTERERQADLKEANSLSEKALALMKAAHAAEASSSSS